MSQTTMLDANTANTMCIQTTPSSACEDSYLILYGDGSSSEQGCDATDTSHNRPWKTSFKNTLTKTGTFMARLFCHQNVEKAVDFYEQKAHDLGAGCRKASRNIYKRATAPGDAAMQSSGSKRSISWIARIAKFARAALCATVIAADVLHATVVAGFEVAHAMFKIAVAPVRTVLDGLCEDE